MKVFNFFSILLLFLVVSCGCSKKSNSVEENTCGCEMSNLDKNKQMKDPNTETMIAYNKKDNNPNNPYGDTFVIVTYANGMSFHMYICNEDILPQEVKNLKGTEHRLKVKHYEGFSKKLCRGMIAPTIYMYEHITLTKIELL